MYNQAERRRLIREHGFFAYKNRKEHFCPQINTTCRAEALAVALHRTRDASALRTTFCKLFFLLFSLKSEEGEHVSVTLSIW